MTQDEIRVLVVDDEPLIAEAHQAYTERVAGFWSCSISTCRTRTVWNCAERCAPPAAARMCWW